METTDPLIRDASARQHAPALAKHPNASKQRSNEMANSVTDDALTARVLAVPLMFKAYGVSTLLTLEAR